MKQATNPTYEEMVRKLYANMADKTISPGCIVENFGRLYTVFYAETYDDWTIWFNIIDKDWDKTYDATVDTIIWHPLMIGDCDVLIEKWPDYFDEWNPILDLWISKNRHIPLEWGAVRYGIVNHLYSYIK